MNTNPCIWLFFLFKEEKVYSKCKKPTAILFTATLLSKAHSEQKKLLGWIIRISIGFCHRKKKLIRNFNIFKI